MVELSWVDNAGIDKQNHWGFTMKVNLDQVKFILVLLREIEKQSPFLFTGMIRCWQNNGKVNESYFIWDNDQETLKYYINNGYDVEKFSDGDKYITIDGTNERVVSFNNIEDYFDLEYMARDIVENNLGHFYFGVILES